MPSDTDKLIYQNSNTYRLHADNIRWTLLGGYSVFLVAIVGLSQPTTTSITAIPPAISLLAFILSFGYLWILAIQNWFYNLFARWVDDCEYRLIAGVPLRSLQTLAKSAGPTVSPFHPAFFFSQLLVGTVSFFFLVLTINNLTIPRLTPILLSLPPWLVLLFKAVGLILYFGLLNMVFRRWHNLVYQPIIRRLSNLYVPLQKEDETIPETA
jgi:hypothetical protein